MIVLPEDDTVSWFVMILPEDDIISWFVIILPEDDTLSWFFALLPEDDIVALVKARKYSMQVLVNLPRDCFVQRSKTPLMTKTMKKKITRITFKANRTEQER